MPANLRNRFRTASSAAVALSISGIALADNGQGPAPVVGMTWDATGDPQTTPFSYNPEHFASTPASFGTWQMGGTAQNPGPVREVTGWRYRGGFNESSANLWSLTWDCVLDPDPFVDATINVTNNSGSEQTFIIFMPLNIINVDPSSQMDGSVSASLSSQSFLNPATLKADAPGLGAESVYQAYINGSLVRSLWNPGYTLTAAPLASAGDTTNFGNEIGPGASGPTPTLGLQLKFRLSAGDSASVTGIFNIVPVPGPASLAVFGVFGLVAGGRRRRA